jgi:hypothetical protein
LNLRDAAQDRRPDHMQTHLDTISATCMACHVRFRDYIGELDIQRVNADEPDNADMLARVCPRGR